MSLLWIIGWLSATAIAHPGAAEHLHATAQAPCQDADTASRRIQALLSEGQDQAARNALAEHRACGASKTTMDLAEAHVEEVAARHDHSDVHAERALTLLDGVLAAEPGLLSALQLRAAVLRLLDRDAEAIALLEQMVATQPVAPEGWTRLAQAHTDAAHHAQAAEVWERAIAALGPLPVLQMSAAQSHTLASQRDQALALLDGMRPTVHTLQLRAQLAATPESASAHLHSALVLAKHMRDCPQKRILIEDLQRGLATHRLEIAL